MGILETLAQKNLIRKEDVEEIKKQVNTSGLTVEKILIEKGVSLEDILMAKGEYLSIPTRTIGDKAIPFSILEYIPEESAIHYRFVPIGFKDGVLEVGFVDPDNIDARDALNFIASKLNLPFKIFLITTQDFGKVLETYKGLSGEVTKALSELETELSSEEIEISNMEAEKEDTETTKPGMRIIEDAPVTKIVATILRYATEGNASDVHIEAMRDKVRVRFRVDGVLNTSLVLPLKVHGAVVARIKILSNMKLDEKRKPQDGRFSARIDNRKIDFRVSTFPAYFGEKVVMRILDQEKGVKKLDDMGLTKRNLELIREAITRPYGLILITGPTGSGKSTTLYSMLNEIDRETENVLSLEDPIEYNIEGMSQSQVKPEIGYTFATGLRTTLRQDPDVIMVGEIRDKETAQLAVQAALTGHLVLSTIHTNNAAGVIPRLIDMGVDPYLIAPTLILTLAQRLVSLLCPGSGAPIPIEGSIKIMLDKQFNDVPEQYKNDIPKVQNVYGISPSADCPNGTRGRIAVFEVFKMDKDIETVILNQPTEIAIAKVLREKGMFTMKEDAIIKAYNKEIPFEEVNKL
ncbi:MAG: type II/IV secretion system protein [Candidatus Taylorbacteria bacterium]|nr:type II/IV secretion system protein [Candidatus Taylorbacteria bacterium]